MNIQEFSRQLDSFRVESAQSQDEQLEDDCILLLGRLELSLELLENDGQSEHMKRSLEVGKDMLVVLLDFVTHRFGNEAAALARRAVSAAAAHRDGRLAATQRGLSGLRRYPHGAAPSPAPAPARRAQEAD